MTIDVAATKRPAQGFTAKLLRRWRRDTRGSTAIEFAMVSLPFLFFTFGTMGLGFYFFTATSLEFGVETAARQIRTGQAQRGGTTKAQFKTQICNNAGSFLDCTDSKMKVHIQTGVNWANIVPTPCIGGGGLSNSAGSGTDTIASAAGGASQVVLVTVCYEWTLAQSLPFLLLGNMSNGSSAIQAVATFRSEPFQ